MKKLICVFLIIIMLLQNFVFAVSFSDFTNTHWAYENVMSLVERGVINGYPDGTYKPENNVTYAEFIKLVVCAYVSKDKIYPSIPGEHWVEGYIMTAEMNELIPMDSISEEKYDIYITRAEMAKFLSIIDKNVTGEEYSKIKELDFIDINELPQEYIEYLDRVVNKGYIQGNPDKTFSPEKNLTRAEMATILTRI